MKIHESGKITLTKEEENFLQNLTAETGIELWNPECTKRLTNSYDDLKVCPFEDPLHGKVYRTMAGALTYLTKET